MTASLDFKMLTKKDVLAILSISERTLENMVDGQTFPPAVKIGQRVYWRPEAVNLWLEAKFNEQMKFFKPGRR